MNSNELLNILEEVTSYKAEERWFEFKLNAGSTSNEQIGEYISALSNGSTIANKPFGYLIWGVDNSTHDIRGTNFSFVKAKQGSQGLELWLRTLLHPKINFTIYEFDYRENKHIVILKIPAAVAEPTHFKKKPWIRIGSHKTDLRNYPHYIRQIYNTLEDWSAKIIEEATIEDLDEHAIKTAREKYVEKKASFSIAKEINSWSDETFLDKVKITINGKITNTAIILLGKAEKSHYILPAISQITWKLETEERAYEHFSLPMLLSTTKVLRQIRNIKYKFFPDYELLATEVNKYDSRVILEALHNCIAHQNYSLNERIIITEKIDRLLFENAGSFFEGKPDDYLQGNKTPSKYRNFWLAQAMVNLNMIDTLGYGIHSMYLAQRERYFPLPEYDLSQTQKVKLTIYGHSIDENYSKLLIQKKDLPLITVVLLDRIQKRLPITTEAAKYLKNEHLIEGRKPNYYISKDIAVKTGQEIEYIKQKGFKDKYYKDLIIEYIEKYGSATKKNITELIFDLLPNILDKKQKENKIRNIVYSMSKKDNSIINEGTTRKSKWIKTSK
ncbi:MAG: putative DNA binding domain-containing protein [Bacteroidales bacterium]|jgi:ATP-dependent DNA helicase RecG|nr:putative DNA binding domain-containing protein [Bacteroidales bacterium]